MEKARKKSVNGNLWTVICERWGLDDWWWILDVGLKKIKRRKERKGMTVVSLH